MARVLIALLLLVTTRAAAQPSRSGQPPFRTSLTSLTSPTSPSTLTARLRLPPAPARDRTGHVLVGGLIGSAAGIVACTAISNYVKDKGTGFSTCTTKGYVGFVAGGFAVGAVIGALIK